MYMYICKYIVVYICQWCKFFFATDNGYGFLLLIKNRNQKFRMNTGFYLTVRNSLVVQLDLNEDCHFWKYGLPAT